MLLVNVGHPTLALQHERKLMIFDPKDFLAWPILHQPLVAQPLPVTHHRSTCQEARGSRHIAMILMSGMNLRFSRHCLPWEILTIWPCLRDAKGPKIPDGTQVMPAMQAACSGNYQRSEESSAERLRMRFLIVKSYLEPSPTIRRHATTPLLGLKFQNRPCAALNSQWFDSDDCDMISRLTSQNPSNVSYVPCCRWTSDFEIQPWPTAKSWVSDSDLVLCHRTTEVILTKTMRFKFNTLVRVAFIHCSTLSFIVSVFLLKHCRIHLIHFDWADAPQASWNTSPGRNGWPLSADHFSSFVARQHLTTWGSWSPSNRTSHLRPGSWDLKVLRLQAKYSQFASSQQLCIFWAERYSIGFQMSCQNFGQKLRNSCHGSWPGFRSCQIHPLATIAAISDWKCTMIYMIYQ